MREFELWLLIVSTALALPVAALTIKKQMLKPAAALLAVVMMLTIGVCGGLWALFVLLFSYLSLALLDKIFSYGIVKATNDVNKKTGARDAVQVLVNGLGGCICVAVYFFTDEPVWLVCYVCAIAEAYADSLSSDIGVLSKREPVDIISRKRVPAGLSGGVTPLGTAVGFIGSLVMGIIGMLCFGANVTYVLSCVIAAFGGCIIDSVLGSVVQAKFRCSVCQKLTEKNEHCGTPCEHVGGVRALDNCMVNLISNFFACGLCVAVYYLLACVL